MLLFQKTYKAEGFLRKIESEIKSKRNRAFMHKYLTGFRLLWAR
jgi:hypothetical protein